MNDSDARQDFDLVGADFVPKQGSTNHKSTKLLELELELAILYKI